MKNTEFGAVDDPYGPLDNSALGLPLTTREEAPTEAVTLEARPEREDYLNPALRAQPQAREDAQPVAWRCSREWPSDGLGKWQYHDGPPNPSHLARNVQALFLHPTPDPQPVGWLRAVDEEMVCAHLGVADAEDSFETAKKKLASLIQWNIAVATDPSVGGYPAPDALRVAVEAFMPLAEVAFLWSKETPPDEEVQRYRDRYWAVKEALATLK